MPRSIEDLNKNLGFGLNARGGTSSAGPSSATKKKKKKLPAKRSVLDGSSSESDDEPEGGGGGGRSDVNREIAAEQAALRRRAEAAMSAASSSAAAAVFDYDGEYESFSRADDDARRRSEQQQQQQPERKSRYIQNLLKTAESRKREHEILHERRVAREQAVEDAKEDYVGKEKFVTKSYKRKLAEQEAWLLEEEEREKQEKEQDRIRKEGGGDGAAMSFLGNVVRGRDGTRSVEEKKSDGRQSDPAAVGADGGSIIGDTANGRHRYHGDDRPAGDLVREPGAVPKARWSAGPVSAPHGGRTEASIPSEPEEAVLRRKRNAKVAAARERYLERKRRREEARRLSAAQ